MIGRDMLRSRRPSPAHEWNGTGRNALRSRAIVKRDGGAVIEDGERVNADGDGALDDGDGALEDGDGALENGNA
ncbi:MAG TPA: hypothetical protein VGJ82_11915 [Thermoanaerobaculia bacterium]